MAALLEVAGLRKRYGAIVVADEVTFSLEAGRCLGIIGPNGAGKSSVFNLIAGTVAPDGGSIRFAERDVTELPAHLRAGSASCGHFRSRSRFRTSPSTRTCSPPRASGRGWRKPGPRNG